MAAVDGLSALRAALMASRPVALQGDQLVIDGAAFPALGETAFHVKNLSGRRYKLLSLWLQYQMRERSFAEHMAFALQHKVTVADMVIVTDKLHVVEYLAGRSTAPDHVDTDKAASALGGGGASVSAPAAGRSGGGSAAHCSARARRTGAIRFLRYCCCCCAPFPPPAGRRARPL